MKNKVLVTGGAGFIGSNLVKGLLEKGKKVVVLDNLSTGFRRHMKPFMHDIQFIKGDIRRPRDVKKAMQDVRVVFHHAAIRSVSKSVLDPYLCHHVNATGTLILLEEASKKRVDRFVMASTSAVYGDTHHFPQKEEDSLNPISPYGASKLAGENYCFSYFYNQGLKTVCLRYFNVYGPNQNPESDYSAVVPMFIYRVRNNHKTIVDGTGKQSRDLVFVKDVVSANLQAGFGPKGCVGKVFNIGSGQDHSVLKILSNIEKFYKRKPNRGYGTRRKGDPDRTYPSISKAKKYLGWKPKYKFERGLKETIQWFEDHNPNVY